MPRTPDENGNMTAIRNKLRKVNIERSPGGTPLVRSTVDNGEGFTPMMTRALRKKFQVSVQNRSYKKSWEMIYTVLEHGSVYFYDRDETEICVIQFTYSKLDSHEIRVIGKSISLYHKDYLFSIMNQATVLKKAQVKNSFAGYLQEKDGYN